MLELCAWDWSGTFLNSDDHKSFVNISQIKHPTITGAHFNVPDRSVSDMAVMLALKIHGRGRLTGMSWRKKNPFQLFVFAVHS